MGPRGAIVAIDGPAGAGKSTLGRRLAEEFGLPFLNTGTMYRALTAEALGRGIDVDDGRALADLATQMQFELERAVTPPSLSVNNEVPGDEISTPEVEAAVSMVARHPEVRRVMASEQRRLGERGAVVEGRDIGTVVFPDAAVKIFLEAAPSERATRRIRERGGRADLGEALAERDARDSRVNPLIPAPDAERIDTTGRTAGEVFEDARAIVSRRLQ
jgi:cytidylate kinase